MEPIESTSQTTDDVFFAVIALSPMAMLVTDPEQADNPIVYANAAFEELFGRPLATIRGSNPRFMGEGAADPAAVQRLREAIRARTPITIELVNRRADGLMFTNLLFVAPIFDAEGRVMYFLGSLQDVTVADQPKLGRERDRAHLLLEQSLQRQRAARSAILQARTLLADGPSAASETAAAIGEARILLDNALDALPEHAPLQP